MAVKKGLFAVALLCAGRVFAEPVPAEVLLPLKDYLSLVEAVERIERQRAEESARQEAPIAEVVAQRLAVTVGAREAALTADFDVLLQGKILRPVLLPLAGFPERIEIRNAAGPAAGASVSALDGGGGVVLAAAEPGRYTVHVVGRAALGQGTGTGRLSLGRVAAAVASTEIDLPADLAWTSPGAVVVEEREEGGRRTVRLATARGAETVLDVRRKVESAEAEKLLAQSVVLTILQLRPEGLRRHDVVLYEVRRGGLGHFTVDLPPGLEIDQAGTDEGTVVPVVEGGRLTVHRQRQLQGVGYLVLSSTPAALPADGLPLAAVQPEPEVRSRYLAISSAVAADVRPIPEASWSRVDLSDLPAALSEALTALDLAAAWRLSGEEAGARLAVARLPAAPLRDAVIRRRDTTTLLTVDGTLLFRDRFLVETKGRSGAALEVTLPAGGRLWSARVDDQAVRPLERAGAVSVPLGFSDGDRAVVEVVSVQERALPPGRSQLALELPQVAAPVLVHRLRLLLPENAGYRFHRGDLRAAPPEAWRNVYFSNVAGPEDPWSQLAATPNILTDQLHVARKETESTGSSGRPTSGTLPAGKMTLYARVVDDDGNPLPGAVVTMSNDFGFRSGVTNRWGVVALNGPGGRYQIKAELEGYSGQELPEIPLAEGRSPGIEVVLGSAVQDVITVSEPHAPPDARSWSVDGVLITDMAASEEEGYADFDSFEEMKVSGDLFRQEAQGLQQGMVAGVKPLPIAIPESGKALAFAGVLPPARVTLELDVKAKGKS